MDASYIVRTTLSKEDARALARQQLNLRLLFLRICSALLIVCLGILWAYNFKEKYLFTLITVLVVAGSFTLDIMVGAGFYKAAKRDLGEVEYAFGDAGIHISCASQETDVPYQAFMNLVETKGYYFLYLQKQAAYILPKRDFVQGNPAEFGAYLAQKTDLPLRKLRCR